MLEPVSTPLNIIDARTDESPRDIPGDTIVDTAGDTPDFRTLRRTDPERARALARIVGKAALAADDRRGAAAALLTLARCELDAADYAAAAAHLDEVQAVLGAENGEDYSAEETEMSLVRALVLCRCGDYDGALTCALAGLEGSRQLDAVGLPDARASAALDQNLEVQRAQVQRVQAQALRVAGEVYSYGGDLEKSCDLLGKALGAAQVLGDPFEVSETLLLLGRSYRLSGDYRQALRYGLEALEHKRAAGDHSGEASALNALGLVYHGLGDDAQALAYYLEGLALCETLKDRRSELALLGNLSEVYSGEAGLDYDSNANPDPDGLGATGAQHLRALEYTRRCLELSEEIGSLDTAAVSLRSLGTLYTQKGDPDEALVFFGRALELQRRLGDEGGQALTLCNLAESCAAAGKPEAAEHLRESLALARSDHARPYVLAQVLASSGAHTKDSQRARQYLNEGLELA